MNTQNTWIENIATTVLGDRRLAVQWLERPNPLFGNVAPLQALTTNEGRRQVRRQLTWFAGGQLNWFASEPVDPSPGARDRGNSLTALLSDPMMDLVLARAGTGPEEFLGLCRGIAARIAVAKGATSAKPIDKPFNQTDALALMRKRAASIQSRWPSIRPQKPPLQEAKQSAVR